MDKLTKEEIREAANNFFCSPEGRPLTIDEAAELICTVDAFEAGVEWAEEKYAQQFERPDNDSGQGWISISEKPNLERNGEVYIVMNIIVWDKVEQCSYALNYSKLSGFNNSDITHWQYFPGAPNQSK